jgi:hypothetical protein
MPSIFLKYRVARAHRCRFSRRAASNWPCGSASEPAGLPSIEPIGLEAKFLGYDLGGLAALTLKPVLNRFIEFTPDFDRCLLHVLHHCIHTSNG